MPLPTSWRKRAGEAKRDRRCWEMTGDNGGEPGVKRRLQHEQQVSEMLQAGQATVACAQTRTWARCQGSAEEGLGKASARLDTR